MEKHKPIIVLSALLFFTVVLLATFIPLAHLEPRDEFAINGSPTPTPNPLSLGITPGPTPVKLALPDNFTWEATTSSPISTNNLPGLTHHAMVTLNSSEDLIKALKQGSSLTTHFMSYPKTTLSVNAGNLTFIPFASESAHTQYQSLILNEDDVLQVVSWGFTTSFDKTQNPQTIQCPCSVDYYVFFSEPQTPQSIINVTQR